LFLSDQVKNGFKGKVVSLRHILTVPKIYIDKILHFITVLGCSLLPKSNVLVSKLAG